MDVPADKVIELYAQELASVQQQLMITRALLAAYQEAEQTSSVPLVSDK